MGLFGSRESLNLEEPGHVEIADHVRTRVPDVGEHFLDFIGVGRDQLTPHIDALRTGNGWVPTGALRPYGFKKLNNGPLTFLNMMVSYDHITMSVWASFGLRGGDKRTVESTVTRVMEEQGHAAAATWALVARPNTRLDLEFLGE
ncbi:hypothetical protein I3F60_20360 [Streptomyces sp. MUM 136J]|uniref:hypothetical protein n=1 Tax=Streptomyces sp. MUM 136J TaxID=2791992 RepID=UPI001F041756|nr:hypothetical protein [Streptomyces sp. MUM 136J]MCH0571588.1 hypothetical protein [Streptomyces sp. MUM 136J]